MPKNRLSPSSFPGRGENPTLKNQNFIKDPEQSNYSSEDTDSNFSAKHHTIGVKRFQATSGAHEHTGDDSWKLGSGTKHKLTLAGDLNLNTVAALNTRLNALLFYMAPFFDIVDNRTNTTGGTETTTVT